MDDRGRLAIFEKRNSATSAVLRRAVDERLDSLAPAADERDLLSSAMRYALLAPGKRVRPLLTMLSVQDLGGDPLAALEVGCALEMVHAASLVMDDLPAMDDAAQRRGRPSTHKAFGEDVAMLASVALLARAHGTVAAVSGLPAETRCTLVAILARAVGESGLALGQLRDLRNPANAGEARIADANHLKTGVLFVAAVDLAATISGADAGEVRRMQLFAHHFGQAYQMLDDLADGPGREPDAREAEDEGRTTLLSRLGPDQAVDRLRLHMGSATDQLTSDSQLLRFVRKLFGPQDVVGTPRLAAALA